MHLDVCVCVCSCMRGVYVRYLSTGMYVSLHMKACKYLYIYVLLYACLDV